MPAPIDFYRRARIAVKKLAGIEPVIPIARGEAIDFHGNAYGGWGIPRNRLSTVSVVVDVGLGEDIDFTRSLINRYGCSAHGFDPTPRAIRYVKAQGVEGFTLHQVGVASKRGRATFYLPNDESCVSGSIAKLEHLGQRRLEVELVTLEDVFQIVDASQIDLLKLDIEGAEYELIQSDQFSAIAHRIGIICVEFHHRWKIFGVGATHAAVRRLADLGFVCVWASPASNEEFTFLRHADR